MSLVAEVQTWLDPDMWDHQPTEEEALRQMLYIAIDTYFEQHENLIKRWSEEIPGLSEWVDRYAESKP